MAASRAAPFGALMAGAAVLCLSFLGFDAVSTLAEECRDARRDVPRAIILTTLFAGLLFTVLAYVSQLVLPGSTFASPTRPLGSTSNDTTTSPLVPRVMR